MRQSAAGRTNPDDLYALEAALWAKSQTGGEVIAVSMGPEKAIETLREAIQRGANRAILLKDTAFAGSDTLSTSRVLAAAVKYIGDYSALFFGRMAIDGDTAQVGPEVAAHLNTPQITSLSKIKSIDNTSIEVIKRVCNHTQNIRMTLPCAIMVNKNYAQLSSPTLQGWRKSQTADIEVKSAEDLNIDKATVGLKASPTRVVKTFRPTLNKEVKKLTSLSELFASITNHITQ